jgi:hypothetical protein
MDIAALEPRRTFLDQEAAHALRSARPDNRDVGHGAIGDPGFFAIEYPLIAALLSGRAHRRGIRAKIGFCQAETADRFSRLQFRKPALLLFIRTVGVDRIHHQRTLNASEAAQTRIAALELLHDEPILHAVHPGAAITFQIRPEKAKLAHLANQLGWKCSVVICLANDRDDPLVHKLARRLAHQQFLLRQQRIELDVVDPRKARHYGYISM